MKSNFVAQFGFGVVRNLRSGENCTIPNSFFQFKRFVIRYAKEYNIDGHSNQTILSKSQSKLWLKNSDEQKNFFQGFASIPHQQISI
ncbi:hypothetical protein Glove_89g120 [Diversispora epigaea]|uniref:HMG box domain-containing protein n=1 Tax=Diversispora epigaea TaxID=1348612 RepID=A0A397J857_9GLOM|nr:hypothetical protein Glove_89g120 [Diversispora epigaea]